MEFLFHDRTEAGQLLAERLGDYAHQDPVVLALPRGGVPVAYDIAQALHAPLDVVLVRKIGAPFSPELAAGAVTEGSPPSLVLNEEVIGEISPAYLESEKERQLGEIVRRQRRYRDGKPPLEVRGKTVILVDDGIATGSTMLAAIRHVRSLRPRQLILATPVAAGETLNRLGKEVDGIVCLHTPRHLFAIGQFYYDFDQVSDDEVVHFLKQTRHNNPLHPASGWLHYPHDADIGVKGYGPTLNDAFEQAALALTAVMIDPGEVKDTLGPVAIHCQAPDYGTLLVDWLNALILEMAVRNVLFGRFEVSIDDHALEGKAWGERIDPLRHEITVEIKGATYTTLDVSRDEEGQWSAACVVDV